jgi:hypothetical protein
MGLKDFERFLRKVSRLLYEDDITPIVIDYLIKYKLYAVIYKNINRLVQSLIQWQYT